MRRPWLGLGLILACARGVQEEPAPSSYTVRRGDTLFVIARDHGVTVRELQEWNGLPGDRIEIGQELRLFGGPSRPPAPPPPADAGLPPLAPPQPCLAQPVEVFGEEGIAAGMGLSPQQIRASLDGFVHHTARCVPPDLAGSVMVTTELVVGCDGRVRAAVVVDAGGAPPAMAACVAETLARAPFPAHDLPDGETFRYPVTLGY